MVMQSQSKQLLNAVTKTERYARSDLLQTISPSKMKQVKGCVMANKILMKLYYILCKREPVQ